MKYIIFAFFLVLSFSSQAIQNPSCSLHGTRVIYTNGINTSKFDASDTMEKINELGKKENLGFNSKIDSKNVTYERAYNYHESFAKDILESVVQRLPQSYLDALHVFNAYAAYSQLLQGNLIQMISSSILNSITEKMIEILISYSQHYTNLPLYEETIREITLKYRTAFLKGERIFAISHSQGSLFMNDVYNILPESETIGGFKFGDKSKYFTGFQIASVLNSEMNTRFGYATNSKDRVVNAVRNLIGALPANLETPLVISSEWNDLFINHGILSTYLYDPTLKPQVISKLIATANLQESNCFYANIEYTKNNLQVLFDSSDPKDRNPEGLIYIWNFGDGQSATTDKELFPHTYLRSGIYSVSLTVKDQSGNEVSTSSSITVVDAIRAIINYTESNLRVNFDSTDPQNPNIAGLTYSWNFGDGLTGSTTSKTLSHNYAQAGTYNVSLTVTDAFGTSDTASASVVVSPAGTSTVIFCNAGLLPSLMNVTLEGVEQFSIDHIFPESGINTDPHTCECHAVQLPKGVSTSIYVEGSGSFSTLGYTLLPYSGSIFGADYTQYFTTASRFINGVLEIRVFSGIYAVNYCGPLIYK